MTNGSTSLLKAILKKENDSGRKWTERHECLELTGTSWVRFITSKSTVSWRPGRHGSSCRRNFQRGLFRENWKVRLPQRWLVRLFSLVVKYTASATKKRKNTKRRGLAWYLASRDRSGETWNETGEHLASLARLPDDRLEKLFSEVTLFQSTQPV